MHGLLRQFRHINRLVESLAVWGIVTNFLLGALLLGLLYLRSVGEHIRARRLNARQRQLLLALALLCRHLLAELGLQRLHGRGLIPKQIRDYLTLLLRVIRIVVLKLDRVSILALRRVVTCLLLLSEQTVLKVLLRQLKLPQLDLQLLDLLD